MVKYKLTPLFNIYNMKFIPYEYDLKAEYYDKLKDQRKAKKANKLRAFGTPKKKNKWHY